MVVLEELDSTDREFVRSVVARHEELTGSDVARHMLAGWPVAVSHFRKVMPLDYRRVLAVMRDAEAAGLSEAETLDRVMAAAHG